jgi:hypothetical protein
MNRKKRRHRATKLREQKMPSAEDIVRKLLAVRADDIKKPGNFYPIDLEAAVAGAIFKLYPDEVSGMSITLVREDGVEVGFGPVSEPTLASKSAGPFTVTATFSFRDD